MKFMHGITPAFPAQELTRHMALLEPAEGLEKGPAHRCPLCRRGVSEEAETCEHCGSALLEVDEEPRGKAVWVMAILGLLGAITFSFGVIR